MRTIAKQVPEAVRALAHLAKDELQGPLARHLAIEVRKGDVRLLAVVMTVEVKQFVQPT